MTAKAREQQVLCEIGFGELFVRQQIDLKHH